MTILVIILHNSIQISDEDQCEWHALRKEQDVQYEESVQVDKAKEKDKEAALKRQEVEIFCSFKTQ